MRFQLSEYLSIPSFDVYQRMTYLYMSIETALSQALGLIVWVILNFVKGSDDMPPPLMEMDEKGGGGSIPLPPAVTPLPVPSSYLNNNNNNQKIVLKHRPSAVRGLVNLGNTCFFNSVLQCLARTPNLVDTLRLIESNDQQIFVDLDNGDKLEGTLEKSGDALGPALSDVLESLRLCGSAVNPAQLLSVLRKRCPQFEGYDQHDAHELLRHLLDNVRLADHKRYKALMLSKMGLTRKVNPTNVSSDLQQKLKALDLEVVEKVTLVPDHVFKGKLTSTLQCQDCNSRSHRVESFLDLSLPIVVDKPQPPCMMRRKTSSPEPEEDDLSKRRQRRQKRRFKRQEDPPNNPAAVVSSDRGESDADVEDNEDGERGRLESGYSSEKGDDDEQDVRPSGSSEDSARASPAGGAGSASDNKMQPLTNDSEHMESLLYSRMKMLMSGGDPCAGVSVCAGVPPVLNGDNSLVDELQKRLGPWTDEKERWEWRRGESHHSHSVCKLSLCQPGQPSAPHVLRDPDTVEDDDPAWLMIPRSGRPPAAALSALEGAEEPTHNSSSSPVRMSAALEASIESSIKSSIAEVVEGIIPSSQEVSEKLESLSLHSPMDTTVADSDFPEPTPEVVSPDPTINEVINAGNYEEDIKLRLNSPVSTEGIANEGSPLVESSEQIPQVDDLMEYSCAPPSKPVAESVFEPPTENCSPPQVNIEDVSDGDNEPSFAPNFLDNTSNSAEAKVSERPRVRGPRVEEARDGECSVQSCLSQFISRELLTGANRVGCSICSKNRGNKDGKVVCTDASKQFLIKEAPQVLILHLKRFQVQMYSFRKLSKHVAFPLILDLAPFCESELQKNEEGNLTYSLYGVVEHSGTLNGGHYVAHIKVENEDDDDDGKQGSRWFCISDAHVTEVTENRVLNSQAYLLFYKRFSRS